MNEIEAKNFENDDLFNESILVRKLDEKAKIVSPDFDVPKFISYKDMIYNLIKKGIKEKQEYYYLSDEQIKFYDNNGYLIINDLLNKNEINNLIHMVDEIQDWKPTPNKWMLYYENNRMNNEKLLCRTENFLPYHKNLSDLITKGRINHMLDQILREKPILFKEKINYKLPYASGFPAHQDAPAFTTFNQKNHITLNIAVDSATIENGCLEVAPGFHKDGILEQNNINGGLSEKKEKELNNWIPVKLNPGDLLLFSSYIPHRSGNNNTSKARRSVYITYNGISDGSFRDLYYEDKRKNFPQECERDPNKDYSEGAKMYNLATPITS